MVRDVVSIALLVGVLVVAPLGATSPYFLITPGGTYDIGSRLRIPDEQRRPMGRMAFTAVYEQEASWSEVAHAKLVGQAEVVPAAAVLLHKALADVVPDGLGVDQDAVHVKDDRANLPRSARHGARV